MSKHDELRDDACNLLFALQAAWPYVHDSCTINSVKDRISSLLKKYGDFPENYIDLTDTHTFNDSVVAGKIMDLLGVAHEVSMEPGVDRLRDSVAELIRQHIEGVEVEEKDSIDPLESREKFEEWIKTRNWFISNGVRLTRSWDGSCYKDNRVQQYWATWQASIRFTKEN